MDDATYSYTNHTGDVKEVSLKYEEYFYPAIFNNFAARMDWAASGEGNRNPVVVVNGSKGFEIIETDAAAGEVVGLDASGTYDPEDDGLIYRWWVMPEADTYEGEAVVSGASSEVASVEIPADAAGKSIHVICEVKDNGTPELTSYRRVIINVR